MPETEALSPATEAWYVLRLADELTERLDAGSLGVSRDIEMPLIPVLARMETQGVTVDAGRCSPSSTRASAARRPRSRRRPTPRSAAR